MTRVWERGCGSRRGLVLLAASLVGICGCEGILDVETSGVIVPGDLDAAGPAGVPTLVNGMVGSYNASADNVARYAALLTDEMILGGTFPDRFDVDRRRILSSNASVTDELYTPLHAARFQADTTVVILEARLADPAFEEVLDQMEEGIALGTLYGGYTRLWLAELFCWSILTGVFPETAPVMPDARVHEAITFLAEAQTLAAAAGLADIRHAAIVGQARAHLWLGNYAEAAALAVLVPRSFAFLSEYSNRNPDQYNQVYTLTYGDTEGLRWTVGDGSSSIRGNEAWEHLGQFIGLNLIRNRPPGFTTLHGSIPVLLQTLYSRPEAEILMASGVEAQLIRAEVLVRQGNTGAAEGLLNDLRSDYSLRATLRWGVAPPSPQSALQPLVLTGDLTADVKRVADERARELWLTGDRQATSRRLRRDPAVTINLFPPVKGAGIAGGDDIAFPIVLRELDNNPNLSPGQACPAGQISGGWS
ncbi:MAG: hypothetical protein WEG36_01425 [Gemmatimonadota bacterium]